MLCLATVEAPKELLEGLPGAQQVARLVSPQDAVVDRLGQAGHLRAETHAARTQEYRQARKFKDACVVTALICLAVKHNLAQEGT